MGRSKEFDRDQALAKAMEVFWDQGYEATSIQDLVTAMGINRSSIYDTFGDKRSLFLAAIALYDKTVICRWSAKLATAASPKQAMIAAIWEMVQTANADRTCRGCLLTNSIAELGSFTPMDSQQLTANLQQMEDALYQALVRAQLQEELDRDRNVRALARLILCTFQGIHVLSKANSSPQTLHDIANQMIAAIGW